ncbi:MAG: phosphoribosylanthranilate isomerase [Porticoccus sp.]|nr:phosphoribosylanthranilate isomerase [Porticoccus sp.]
MNRTRVKICGITRVEDATTAVNSGADAIGLVFYPKSPRYVELSSAGEIARTVGPFVTVVGLFVNASVGEVNTAIGAVGLDLLQFHGDESEAYCSQFQKPFIKAIRMSPGLDVREVIANYPSARGFLFDAWNENKYGGTGETFEWQRLSAVADIPFILAGGLNPENVKEAISVVKPYAVDVSGGVEASPGIKSSQLIQQFINRATSS